MTQETMYLKNEGFAGNICEKLDENFLFSNFTDVTLVSDDGRYFQAHKIVLSSASEILRDIFHLQIPQEPIIFFHSIKQEHLKALLDYMYLGYASVSFQNTDAFKELAAQMKLIGLENSAIVNFSPENLKNNDIRHNIDTVTGTVEFGERPSTNINCDDAEIIEKESQDTGEKSRPSGLTPVNKLIDLNERNKEGRRIIQCGLCDFKNVKTKVEEHSNFKHEGKGYKCDKCEYKAGTKQTINEHKATKHEGREYRCAEAECNYVSMSKGCLRNHKKVVHDGFRYSCDKCDFLYAAPDKLRRHINVIHNGKRIICDICGHGSKTRNSDKLHRRAKHENVEYKCEFCDFVTGWPDYLRTHMNRQHLKTVKEFYCEKCGSNFKTKAQLKNHTEVHHSDTKYKCNQCTYVTKTKVSLDEHRKTKHECMQHLCSQCDYKTGRISNLRTHQKVLHEGIRHLCDECDYQATRLDYLKIHRRSKHNK